MSKHWDDLSVEGLDLRDTMAWRAFLLVMHRVDRRQSIPDWAFQRVGEINRQYGWAKGAK